MHQAPAVWVGVLCLSPGPCGPTFSENPGKLSSRGFQSNANEVEEHMIKAMEHTTKAKECAKKAKDYMHEAREHTIKATSYATRIPRDANLTMKANELSTNLTMKVIELSKEVNGFARTSKAFHPGTGDIPFYTTLGALLMYYSCYNTWQFWNILWPRKAAAAEVPKPLQTAISQL